MWFDELKGTSIVMDYDVYNESHGYDEYYSESPSEFFTAPSVGEVGVLSYAQESILSAVLRKFRSRF